MKRALSICWISVLLTTNFLSAQERSLVLLSDKADSPYSVDSPEAFLSEKAIQRREKQDVGVVERDLPVNPLYLAQLAETGAEVLQSSRWLNAVLVMADDAQLAAIEQLPFVMQTGFPSGRMTRNEKEEAFFEVTECEEDSFYGNAYEQNSLHEIECLHGEGYDGTGIWIAVFDSGFDRVDTNPAYESTSIIDTYDFVFREEDVFEDHNHGATVLSVMAAYLPEQFVGAAPNASYLLYKTEDTRSETKFEEFFWLLAAERADSIGADIISSSLGYFDTAPDPYTVDQLDGETALVTRAADWAASTGMLVVSSAGNFRNCCGWGKISFPADGDRVLAVGGVNADSVLYSSSGPGPTVDGRIKPDVASVARNTWVIRSSGSISQSSGNSFSAPIISGFAACLWQAYPKLTAFEMFRYIREAGHLKDEPNNDLGYGIPSYGRFREIVGEPVQPPEPPITHLPEKPESDWVKLFPNPLNSETLNLSFSSELLGQTVSFNLFSPEGKKIQKTDLFVESERQQIELPVRLPSGTYWLFLEGKNIKETFPVVIE